MDSFDRAPIRLSKAGRRRALAPPREHRWPVLCACACCLLAGCGDRVRKPSPEELAEFTGAQAAGPAVDMDRVLLAEIPAGPYRTEIGDILQLEMPGSESS